jgi:hypothetical protein
MDALTFVSVYRESRVPLVDKVALRYNSQVETPEQVAKEFFDEWVKDHRRSFGSPLYSYEIYERGEGLDFVLMYSYWILDAS